MRPAPLVGARATEHARRIAPPRPYDANIGRFYPTDPIIGASLNAYDYAGQDQINGNDLDGRLLANRDTGDAGLSLAHLSSGGGCRGVRVGEERAVDDA